MSRHNAVKLIIRIAKIIIPLVTVVAIAAIIGVLFSFTESPFVLVRGIATWFDSAFFQYNVLLVLFSIIIIPVITIFYNTTMRGEKLRRLEQQVPAAEWDTHKAHIRRQVNRTFRTRNYVGGIAILLPVVLFGTGILLLFKPMPLAFDNIIYQTGVDFRKGANFLMLGPFMDQFLYNKPDFMRWLMVSLTAFQFGFTGAYIFFLTHLVRSYFTLNLRPNLFVSSSVRMIMGSVLSVVISFAIVQMGADGPEIGVYGTELLSIGWLAVFSFGIGYFPDRALLWIDKKMTANLRFKKSDYESTPLEKMSGMSYSHEIQLRREGYDNVENLACANSDCLELAVKTGFNYQQLRAWVGEAWMRIHLRDDYDEFQKLTGIVTSNDLAAFLAQSSQSSSPTGGPQWDQILTTPADVKPRLVAKAEMLCRLLPAAHESLRRTPV